MVDAQPGVAFPALASVVPKGERHLLAVHFGDGIRPPLRQDARERIARLWLQQGVIPPGVGLVDVCVGGHDVPVAQKYDRMLGIPQLLGTALQPLEPSEFVVELGARLRIAIGQVEAGKQHAADGSLQVAGLLVCRVTRQCRDHGQRLRASAQNGNAVPGALTYYQAVVPSLLQCVGREISGRAFDFLQRDNIGLCAAQPVKQQR